MQRFGIRKMEAFILAADLDDRAVLRRRDLPEQAVGRRDRRGLRARGRSRRPELYVAIGILGATVMPHNLYLHSALVQSRDVTRSREAVAEACKYNLIDSAIAMNCAFLVNAAILIVAAATFWQHGHRRSTRDPAGPRACWRTCWARRMAPIAFALALLCAGQSSTITGTLAGQITMEGFLRFRIRPWLRRLITRMLAIVPAVAVILTAGRRAASTSC